MHTCQTIPAEQPKEAESILANAKVRPAWSPICCGRDMYALIRRMIVGSDGQITFCSVWNCTVCGRLLL